MKKRIIAAILIMVSVLSLFACGNGEKTDGNKTGIQLTKENYEQYLTIQRRVQTDGSLFKFHHGVKVTHEDGSWSYEDILNSGMKAFASCEATSTNFNYNDVVIKVRLKIDFVAAKEGFDSDKKDPFYTTESNRSEEFEMVIKTNIAGKGQSELVKKTLEDGWYWGERSLVYKDFEVIEISGTVTPA